VILSMRSVHIETLATAISQANGTGSATAVRAAWLAEAITISYQHTWGTLHVESTPKLKVCMERHLTGVSSCLVAPQFGRE
jgi:hypothetical protein